MIIKIIKWIRIRIRIRKTFINPQGEIAVLPQDLTHNTNQTHNIN